MSDDYSKLIHNSLDENGKVSKQDFTCISIIGTGSYGKVYLVKKNDSG